MRDSYRVGCAIAIAWDEVIVYGLLCYWWNNCGMIIIAYKTPGVYLNQIFGSAIVIASVNP